MEESTPLAIEWRALKDVRPYPGNPRNITDAAIAKVAASIKAFGWRQPAAGEMMAFYRKRHGSIRLDAVRVRW